MIVYYETRRREIKRGGVEGGREGKSTGEGREKTLFVSRGMQTVNCQCVREENALHRGFRGNLDTVTSECSLNTVRKGEMDAH